MTKKSEKNGIEKLLSKDFEITSASIKDDFCNYSFLITSGVGLGDVHAVKGSGIIKDDMTKAFQKLNVHLAFIDDVFTHSKKDVQNIDKFHNDELAGMYSVNGFKITGPKDDESIVLVGTKYVSAGGQIKLETPKIPLDHMSSYKWFEELKAASDVARKEVELYKGGKCTVVEEVEDPKQLRITESLDEKEQNKKTDELLQGAKV